MQKIIDIWMGQEKYITNFNLDSTDVRSLKQKRKKTKKQLYFNVCSTNDFEIAISAAYYLKNTFTNTDNQGQATYFTIRIDVSRTYMNVLLFIYVSTEIRNINMHTISKLQSKPLRYRLKTYIRHYKRTTCTYNVTLSTVRLSI